MQSSRNTWPRSLPEMHKSGPDTSDPLRTCAARVSGKAPSRSPSQSSTTRAGQAMRLCGGRTSTAHTGTGLVPIVAGTSREGNGGAWRPVQVVSSAAPSALPAGGKTSHVARAKFRRKFFAPAPIPLSRGSEPRGGGRVNCAMQPARAVGSGAPGTARRGARTSPLDISGAHAPEHRQ